jgi:aspartate-semialdehyde dehydrogenase
LLYVQLVLLMIEELGQKLLAQPEHVLRFIEGVLADEAQALNENKDAPLIIEEVNQKPSEGHTDLSEGDIEKMGIVETAIQLLLVINQGG